MKRAKRIGVIALCFLVIFAWFAPLSEAALLASFGAKTAANAGKTGLSPAMPPNMENDSNGTEFSQGGVSADRSLRSDIFGGAFNLPQGVRCFCAGLLSKSAISSGKARIKLLEVMLC